MVLCERVDPEFEEEFLDPATSTEGSPLLDEGKSQTLLIILNIAFQTYFGFTLSHMASFIRNVWAVAISSHLILCLLRNLYWTCCHDHLENLSLGTLVGIASYCQHGTVGF